jgi:hypothetical protein
VSTSLRVVGIAALAAALAGCASGRAGNERTPEEVVRAYVAALRAGQYERAYELTSSAFRKRHSQKEFVERLAAGRQELGESLRLLGGDPVSATVTATVAYGSGDALLLEMDGGRWTIASDPTEFYGQRTPEEALRSFVRAVERRRYDIVLRFVPARWAGAMTAQKLRQQWEGAKREELAALLKRLKENLGAPIRISDDRASMPYGDRFEVRFVREDGVWKIEDPD